MLTLQLLKVGFLFGLVGIIGGHSTYNANSKLLTRKTTQRYKVVRSPWRTSGFILRQQRNLASTLFSPFLPPLLSYPILFYSFFYLVLSYFHIFSVFVCLFLFK